MQGWSFLTLVLAALAIGAPLAHALEMPVRRTYDAALWVAVPHPLGAIEVGAVVAAVIWAVLVARRRSAPAAAPTHATRAALFLLGFCALLASVFRARFPPPHREADDVHAPLAGARPGETTG